MIRNLLVLGAIAILLSLSPDFYRLIIIPNDTVFPLIHNNKEDYFYYLSLIKQGMEGNLMLSSRMTSEDFKPAFAQTYFALLGIFANFFSLSPEIVYFLARIISAFLLLWIVYRLSETLFKSENWRLVAFIMAVFSTGFWVFTSDTSNPLSALGIKQFLTHWTKLDPIQRTTYLPHHIFSAALGIASILKLFQALRRQSLKIGFTAGLLSLISGFVYFATIVNLLGALIMSYVVYLGKNIITQKTYKANIWKKLIESKEVIIVITVYLIFSLIPLIYFFWLSKTSFPWSSYGTVGEKFTIYLPFEHYIYTLGPAFILTLIGIKLIFTDLTFLKLFLFSWALFPIIGIFVLSRIFWSYGNVYYLESSNYIPLGILSVFGMMAIFQFLKERRVLSSILFLLLLLYFVPPTVSSIVAEANRLKPYYYNEFIPKKVMNGIDWLNNFTPKESVVLAGGFFGPVIPAFSHNRVVYGHPANTYKASEKKNDIDLFFSQSDEEKAGEILQKYKVSYVFFALDNDIPRESFIKKLLLDLVYQNEIVKIYRVIK